MAVTVPAPQNYTTLIENVEIAADQSASVVASAGGVPITQGQIDQAIAEAMESQWNNLDPNLYDSITYADGTRSFWTKASDVSRTFPSLTNSNAFTTINNKFLSPVSNYVQSETALWQFGLDSDFVPIVNKVVPAIGAASVGITLGKTIDSALYNANPDFWDSIGMSSLNPETWASITSGDASLGASLFNMVFGINPQTGATQAYMQQEAFAYLAQWMNAQGIFNAGAMVVDPSSIPSGAGFTIADPLCPIYGPATVTFVLTDGRQFQYNIPAGNVGFWYIEAGTEQVMLTYGNGVSGGYPYTYDGKTAYTASSQRLGNGYMLEPQSATLPYGTSHSQAIWSILYGDVIEESAIDGIGTQPNATTPDTTNWDNASVDDVIESLKQQYPELWQNARTYDVVQPDGTTRTFTYIPTGFPNFDDPTQPTTGVSTQVQPAITPESPAQTITNISETMAPSYDPSNPDSQPPSGSGDGTGPSPNPSPTGTGVTPIPLLPTGSAHGLFGIYNPTQAELNAFGSWLWTGNVFDQILKLFNDPMQSIIGLHKIFVSPPISGQSTIHVGYLDSGVSSNVVGGQYVTVDCGSVSLYEQFANVFDYDPYTDVQLYLPFVGIVNLSTADVMRSTIGVTYRVDVLSGACLADVNVQRDGGGGTIYTFAGNCAVQYPISSGTYIGILGAVAGAATAVLSGGKLLSAAGMASHARAQVQHSGSFSGNAGAMGIKKPYLIISRPQTKVADTFPALEGYPTNYSTRLGDCSGQVRVRAVHVEGINATDTELGEIENLLLSGILV